MSKVRRTGIAGQGAFSVRMDLVTRPPMPAYVADYLAA